MSLKLRLCDIFPAAARKAACLSGTDTLAKAVKALAVSDASAVLVALHGEVEGIVTRGDTLRCMGKAATAVDVLSWRLEQIMSAPVVTALIDETIEEALYKMASAGVKHLPLRDSHQITVIVHLVDLLKYKADLLQAETEQLHDYIDHLHEAGKD